MSSLVIILVPDGSLPDSDGQLSWRNTCWDCQDLVALIHESHLCGGGSGGQIGLWGRVSLQDFGIKFIGGGLT